MHIQENWKTFKRSIKLGTEEDDWYVVLTTSSKLFLEDF